MEPQIQYAQTKDGVSIAFWTMGEGEGVPYVMLMNIPFSNVQLESRAGYKGIYDRMASRGQFVRFDHRGFGLSGRDIERFSLDTWLMDLEAVVDALGLERFALSGSYLSGPIAIAYAERHPDRLSHLLLSDTGARVADGLVTPAAQSLAQMMVRDWEMFSHNVGGIGLGWGREDAVRYGEFVRESATPDVARHTFGAMAIVDVSDLLPRTTTPTLVIRHTNVQMVTDEMMRELAARIPGARLVTIDSNYTFDWEPLATILEEFLDGKVRDAAAVSAAAAVHTILFTDVEGSTALTDRLGDAKARELLREHERTVREALKAHGGSEVKTMGDGFIASFSSATKALECAIAMQRAFAELNESAEEPIKVRVGMNAGEPIAEDDDLFGTAVNLAARICSQAEAGQILAPIVVRELAAGKQFMFADLGETELRGFEDPVRLYELRWQE